jgi:hypothetical protein
MKTRNLLMTAVALTAVLAFSGESFARGGGNGGGGGMQVQSNNRSQYQTKANAQTNQVRPEGSQRRDGSFLTSGTTASGATTRPSNGRGVMDGTGINAAVPVPTTPVQ